MRFTTRPMLQAVLITVVLVPAVSASRTASADTTCESALAGLQTVRPDGRGTIDLEHKAQNGDCTAAASIVRRARNVEGFAKSHCPSNVLDAATTVLKMGQDILDRPECQN